MLSRSYVLLYILFFQNQEIKLRENFELSCRVVEFFEEEPYDPDETQDILSYLRSLHQTIAWKSESRAPNASVSDWGKLIRSLNLFHDAETGES